MTNRYIPKIKLLLNNFFDMTTDDEITKLIKYQLIYILTLLFFLVLPTSFLSMNSRIFILAWTGNITFMVSVYLYYKCTSILLSPYILFFLSFFLFHFGQPLLYSFGFDYEFIYNSYYANYWENSEQILFNGMKMIIVSISMFNLGGLWSFKLKTKNNENFIPNKRICEMKSVGWFLFIFTLIPYYYNKFQQLSISIQHGYQGIYEMSNVGTIRLSVLNILFVPSCVLLLVSYKDKKINYIFQVLLGFTGLIGFISGGRTESMGIFVMLFLYNIIENNSFKVKNLVLLSLSGYGLLLLLSSFSNFRLVEDKSIVKYLSVLYASTFMGNPITKIIGEMGWSMGTVFMTISVVPKYIFFGLGSSYFASLSRFFPTSLDPTGVVHNLHEISSYPSVLLTKYFKTDFGMDTTLIAESYYNFGYLGIFYIVFIGLVMGKILGYKLSDNIVNKRFSLYIKLIASYSLFTLPRRHFGYLVNQLSYTILLVYLMILFLVIIRKKYWRKQKNDFS